jgi:hypothetical protein
MHHKLNQLTVHPAAQKHDQSISKALPLKILPLGASIVYGTDSSDGNGFRLHLKELLEQGGNNVTYVGTIRHGNMTNNLCEACKLSEYQQGCITI